MSGHALNQGGSTHGKTIYFFSNPVFVYDCHLSFDISSTGNGR